VSALDANASGGYYVTLNGDGTGDYIEFTLTNVPAGAYHLKLVFRSGSNRGQLGLKLDGNSLAARSMNTGRPGFIRSGFRRGHVCIHGDQPSADGCRQKRRVEFLHDCRG